MRGTSLDLGATILDMPPLMGVQIQDIDVGEANAIRVTSNYVHIMTNLHTGMTRAALGYILVLILGALELCPMGIPFPYPFCPIGLAFLP